MLYFVLGSLCMCGYCDNVDEKYPENVALSERANDMTNAMAMIVKPKKLKGMCRKYVSKS